MDPQLIQLIDRGGLVVLLLVILVGGSRGWWVFGWHYRHLKAQHDMWQRLALRGTHLAEESVRLARRSVSEDP